MSNKIIEIIKSHPYATAIGIFAIGAIYVVRSSNSNTGVSAAPSPIDAASVAAGTQLQLAQVQAQQAANQTNAQAGVANNQIAGQIDVAQLAATVQQNSDNLNYQTQQIVANLSAQTTQVVSSLQAQVSENQTNNQTAQENILANAEIQIASFPYLAAMAGTPAQIQALQNQIASLTGQITSIANTSNSAISTLYGDIPQPGALIGYANNTAVVAGDAQYAAAAHTAGAYYTAPTVPGAIH